MNASLKLAVLVVGLVGVTACNITNVHFRSGERIGFTTDVDTESGEVTITRGAALAFDCTETTELWSGPCRDFELRIEDDDVAELVPAVRLGLDAAAVDSTESEGQTLSANVEPTSGVLIAKAEGDTVATVRSRSSEATFTVVVLDRPGPEPQDDEGP
jgi:hypothetical protein